MSRKRLISGLILCMALVFAGCAALEQSGLWKKPGLKFNEARIAALDFEGITLDLDLNISNPNAYGIAYSAMEYKLNLQNTDFLSGTLEQSGNIEAGQTQKVTLPIAFLFADMLELVKNSNGDTIAYGLDAAMLFDIPLVGEVKLPVKTKGTFPIPKAPGISLSAFNIEKLSMTGARVKLKLDMENPNTFGLVLGGFDYVLGLNGKNILSGKNFQKQTLGAKGKGSVEIPVELSFLEGGMAVYNILSSGGDLQYNLSFNSILETDLPALQSIPFATQKSGTVNLTK